MIALLLSLSTGNTNKCRKQDFVTGKIRKKKGVEKGGTLRLRPDGCHSPSVVLHQVISEPNRSSPRGTLCRRLPTLFNCCFETCQKHLARPASVKVPFHFLTQRVVQLLIEVVREFGEHGLTAWRCGFVSRGTLRQQGAGVATRPRFPGFHQFFSNKQPGAVQSNPNRSGAKARNLCNIFVGETFHIAQHQDNAILSGQFLNCFPQHSCFFTSDRGPFRVYSTRGTHRPQFPPIRHKFFERKLSIWSELTSAPAHQATVLRNLVEPDYERLRAVEFRQMWN